MAVIRNSANSVSNDRFGVKATPLQYINRKKIEHAQLTLVTSDTQVKDVALNLGFEDYSYFNRLFKKLVGTTPQEYRHSNHKI